MDRLTATGLAFQTMAAAMYVDRCEIRRLTSTTGPRGGQIPAAPVVIATGVPCRIMDAGANERQIAGATQGETVIKIKMPAWHNDQPLQVEARCEIEIAARGAIPAQVFNVVAPPTNRGSAMDVTATKIS